MHFVALLSLLCVFSSAHASDYIEENVEQIQKSDLAKHIADIELIVIDESNNKYKFYLHSEALQLSKYFYFILKLKDNNILTVQKFVFHTPSIAIFKKILDFMYGALIQFESHEQLLDILLLQHHLEIDDLDKLLIAEIERNLCAFTSKILTQLLKNAYRDHRPLGKKCSEIILSYIALNYDKSPNCDRNELTFFLKSYPTLVDEVYNIIADDKKTPIVAYSPKLHDKTQKIYYKPKDDKKSVSVFYSKSDAEKALKKQKSISNKYKIKNIGK